MTRGGEVILSINLNHDGAAVLLREGRICGYVNTERFSRIKKHPGIRAEDLENVLDQAGVSLAEVDTLILQNYGVNYPEIERKYGTDFRDTWVRFSVDETARRVTLQGKTFPFIGYAHFLCHAAAAFYFSDFETALCLAYDPMGSGVYMGQGHHLTEIDVPKTLVGLVYNEISIHLGFGGVLGAGKTMGLAPYGPHGDARISAEMRDFARRGVGRDELGHVINRIIALAAERPNWVEEGTQRWNATAAYLAQELLEETLDSYLDSIFRLNARRRLSGKPSVSPRLCLAGGTALNSVANQKCFARSRFTDLFLHPASGDDGTAIGAALYHWHDVCGHPRMQRTTREAMYSVRSYEDQIDRTIASSSGAIDCRPVDDTAAETATLLAQGHILGWFQGASEIGPRALGHRSILCHPGIPGMKETLNSRVKFREGFRPFAPSVLNEYSREWFGLDHSPFMLRVAPVLKKGASAITHCDRTARPQTVREEDDPAYHRLIEEFLRRTGIPMVLNTSFNIKGDPIVETPEDAVRTLLATQLDGVVLPGRIVTKSGAPLAGA